MAQTSETWQRISWKDIIREVRRMQAEIVKAEQAGDTQRVRDLQDQLVHSRAAKLLAVRQVTSTGGGRRTPGIDGQLWDTPERKLEAAQQLDPHHYRPQPARRVAIPKEPGYTRPLGILTMKDRAMQALHLLALDPVAETRADPHSYGFRKYRSAADAIARCEEIFHDGEHPWWILNADIERCFEMISHDWLLHNIPLDSNILQGWLTAGYIEQGQVYTPDKGLPQGGILSPTLANMALDGLEPLLEATAARRRRRKSVYLVRYADDFLVMSPSKRWLSREAQPCIEEFLKSRGMRLSLEKTTIIHLKQGIEFLGFHLRYRRGTLRIEPSKANVEKVLHKIEGTIRAYPDASPTQLIQVLTPIIRGWTEYYKRVEIRALFAELDRRVADRLWQWALVRHPGVLKRRRARQYFVSGPGNLRLFTDQAGQTLYCAQAVPLIRYVPIDPACNAYDSTWQPYLQQRHQPS
jgi:RNA-directed DNA polymerase